MESVILLGLMGVGYLMNKDKDDKHKIYSEVQPPLFNGSGNSVYDHHKNTIIINYFTTNCGFNVFFFFAHNRNLPA